MRRAALALAAALGITVIALALPSSAATVPTPPSSCSATVVSGGVTLAWTAPSSDGGSPLKWYALKVKGSATVLHTTDGTQTSYLWTGAYQPTDTFQVRAVNSVGFSTWCEATLGTAPAPSPTPTPTPTPASPFLAYTPGAYFRSAPGPVDQAATTAMRNFLTTFPAQKGTAYPLLKGVGGNAWGMVYAEGHASDPVWKLTGAVPAAVSTLATTGFHAPAWLGDVLTGTSDSPFVVIDRATGISVWGAKASKGAGNTINVGAAGYFDDTSNGLDKRRPESDSTVNFRSRGAIPDAMVVRKDLVDYAIANHTDLGHVLHLFWVETNSAAGVKFPMVGAESGQSGWGAEGQRVAIDPNLNLDTRNCSPVAKVIALTLQRHGAYIGDNAGSGTSIKLEQETPTHPVWGPSVTADELAGCVTWADFVATTS